MLYIGYEMFLYVNVYVSASKYVNVLYVNVYVSVYNMYLFISVNLYDYECKYFNMFIKC